MRSELPPVPGSSGSESSYHHSPSKPISFNLVTLQSNKLHREKLPGVRSCHSEIYKIGRDPTTAKHRNFKSTGRKCSTQRMTAITQLDQVEEKDNPS